MWMTSTPVRLLQKTTINATRVRTADAPHYIQRFFAQYPTFDYQVDAPFLKEFKRLCRHMEWERPKNITEEAWKEQGKTQEKAKREAKSALKTAMVHQFNHTYGRDANDLAAWQHLCNALGFKHAPQKVADCKQLVTHTHVNLVDFIQAPDPEKPVPTFPNEVALSAHTREEEKYFPGDEVNAGSLLKCLLRNIRKPSPKYHGKICRNWDNGHGRGR